MKVRGDEVRGYRDGDEDEWEVGDGTTRKSVGGGGMERRGRVSEVGDGTTRKSVGSGGWNDEDDCEVGGWNDEDECRRLGSNRVVSDRRVL